MCSTTSENVPGWYRQLLAAAVMQFPPAEKIGQENGVRLLKDQDDLRKRLLSALGTDQTAPATAKFELVKDLGIIEVPADYDHGTRLDSFIKANRNKFYGVNDAITDQNFSPKATTKLTPGRKIQVTVYKQTVSVSTTSVERMDFLRQQPGNLFLGAHGVTLVWDKREELPKGHWYCSFDEKDALWQDTNGGHMVPYLPCISDGDFGFNLGDFERDWSEDSYLLGFSDVSDKASA